MPAKIGITQVQRDVLAVMLAHYGEPLPCKKIVAEIWPDPNDEPDWAEAQVYTAIRNIRRRFPGLMSGELFVVHRQI